MQKDDAWQGKFARIGLIFLIALVFIFGYLGYNAGRFTGALSEQAMDYGQLARNLATGHGYTTNILRPLTIAKMQAMNKQDNLVTNHPEIISPPLFPAVASVFMRMMPKAPERAITLAGGFAFLLTVPIIFFLGWQMFDLRTGLLAASLWAISQANLAASISGLETPWLSFWVALLFLVLFSLARKVRWRLHLAAVAGIVVALCYLTHYSWMVCMPVVAIYIFFASDRKQRWIATGVFLAVFIIALLPWAIRNMNVAGAPLYSLRSLETMMGTRTNPGNTLYRQYVSEIPSVVSYVMSHPKEIGEKVLKGLAQTYTTLALQAGVYVTPFFLVAMLVPLGAIAFERLRYLWYWLFGILALSLLVVNPLPRMLFPFGTVAVVIAAGFFLRLVGTRIDTMIPTLRLRWLRTAIAILVLLQAVPVLLEFAGGPPAIERQLKEVMSLCRQVSVLTEGPIITDQPFLMAWYGDRPVIWFPKTYGDLQNMNDAIGKVRWMMLTSQITDERYIIAEFARDWSNLYRASIFSETGGFGYKPRQRLGKNITQPWILFETNPKAPAGLPQ